MEWGKPRLRQRTLAKRRTGFDMHSHKEPMNAVTDSRIGAELHRALRGNARHSHERSSRRLANFFFVLFLFGKEKGHLQTRIPFFYPKNIPRATITAALGIDLCIFCNMMFKQKIIFFFSDISSANDGNRLISDYEQHKGENTIQNRMQLHAHGRQQREKRLKIAFRKPENKNLQRHTNRIIHNDRQALLL